MRYFALAGVFALSHCVQSTAIVDPVTNSAHKGSTAPTQGTLTLSVSLTAQGANHQNQAFTALLFKGGVLSAIIDASSNRTTNGSGQATVTMSAVTTGECLATGQATLANDTYDLYFAILYNSLPAVTTSPSSCSNTGHFETIVGSNNLYTARRQVVVNGNTTYSINDNNVTLGKQHTFQITGLTPTRFTACFLMDSNSSTAANKQPVAYYNGTTDGAGAITLVGSSGNTHMPPPGTYKYFCYHDASNNGFAGDSGDKAASGLATVTGGATTYLPAASFSTVP